MIELSSGQANDEFRVEVLAGLLREQKTVPPKYLYDERGSQLFEQICEVEEYYLTRCENAILRTRAKEIANELGTNVIMIEPGSGNCRKATFILKQMKNPVGYIPIDIARDVLKDGALRISLELPSLAIFPAYGDCARDLTPLKKFLPSDGRCVVFFPGSTIGNFEPSEAERFLLNCIELVGSEGALLIGFDLVKPAKMLEAAYDDARGITAAFNLNLLERMNRELDAQLDLLSFSHRAIYDPFLQRVEMHLVSAKDQKVRIADRNIVFNKGETIHTESSHKYTVDSIRVLGARAGLRLAKTWMDARRLFCMALFRP